MRARGGLDQLLERYGIDPASVPARQLHSYLSLLEKWNATINLTASTSWDCIGSLFEEAVWAAGYYPANAVRHLDIGSGAGFPALPLRVTCPAMRLELIESRSRRSAFLETVVSELSLDGVRVFNTRLEDHLLRGEGEREWDIVSWKAIRLDGRELGLLLRHCAQNTQIWLFHSRAIPVGDSALLESAMRLDDRKCCPARKGWFLSIYSRRGSHDVSRET